MNYANAFHTSFSLFPSWRDLYHFENPIKMSFNDGKKFEDLSKVYHFLIVMAKAESVLQQLLFVAHNSFERSKKSPPYLLLRILRSYIELDTYLAFDVQTEETIAAGHEEMSQFQKLISVSLKF